MKDSMIDWILETTEESRAQQSFNSRAKTKGVGVRHSKYDDVIMFCVKCKKTWQKNRKMVNRKWEYYPKGNIPTIGKKRKQCPNCMEEK